jgi:hypothetical protein
MKPRVVALVVAYLAAIVGANLIVNHYGPWITPYVAFALIGLDLTARDGLHAEWQGRNLWLRFAGLIAVGSLLTWLLNRGAGPVAAASIVAFAAAAAVDTVVFQVLRGQSFDTRVTTSNICAAAVDSVLFLWLAFGVVNGITFAQFCAKVAGGVVWLLALKALADRAVLARRA